MQKKQNSQRRSNPLRAVVICAFMAAMSIVFGKYLAINLSEVIRISFENLPIIFIGFTFGPVAGALTAVCADLIGCVMVGYAINPVVTLGAFLIGATSGVYRYLPKPSNRALKYLEAFALVLLSHFIGSVICKTIGLAAFYDMPFVILMLWRALNYFVLSVAESLIIATLLSSETIRRALDSFF